jgi:hypothetical protein
MTDDAAAAASLGPLDFVYAPSTDVAADVQWFVDVLGAELDFAIDADGTRVASVRVGIDAPALLLTDHLPDNRPVFLYRVESLSAASKRLRERGWTPSRTLELPPGPCATFLAPGGLRLAIYERSRPFVVESFAGRRDF